jgi:Domain of unknown function (DUF4263)
MLIFTDFVVGRDNFESISVHPKLHSNYYWLWHNERGQKIRFFILDERPQVEYMCQVTLIKKGAKFTPRLHFTIRKRNKGQPIHTGKVKATPETITLRASVNLGECHENYWKLVSYLKNMADLDVPDESFSLRKKSQEQITEAFSKLDSKVAKDIVKNLAKGVGFTAEDLNQILERKKQLRQFEDDLVWYGAAEEHWQEFFFNNKWIFGYGLNYVILDVHGQPYVGGKDLEGRGGQNPDYFAITQGNVKFSVIVEIKTPDTPLLRGDREIRKGAWSLSKELTDAVAQIQSNTDQWNVEGARTRQNQPLLEGIHTVTPKGILVAGSLSQFKDEAGKDVQTKALTFERFRRSLGNLEIMTFDELYERARFIVEQEPVE